MTIDANIIIGYLNGDAQLVATLTTWKQAGTPLLPPTIVEAEVLSFPRLTPSERQVIGKFLEEHFISVPCDRTIARLAASLRSTSSIRLPDAIIAASALVTNTVLATRNVRDFRNIQGLMLVTP
ncbi:MAG: type II toxin-antitoxin system VapC family toxin [Patescibacteria group bacterium]